jgi:hypothetical protein
MPDLWWYRYFPRAKEIDAAMVEPLKTVVDAFTVGNWEFVALDEVVTETAWSRSHDFERLVAPLSPMPRGPLSVSVGF